MNATDTGFLRDKLTAIKPEAIQAFRLKAKELNWPDIFTDSQIVCVKDGIRDGRLHDNCIILIEGLCTEDEAEVTPTYTIEQVGELAEKYARYAAYCVRRNVGTMDFSYWLNMVEKPTGDDELCSRCQESPAYPIGGTADDSLCQMCRIHPT